MSRRIFLFSGINSFVAKDFVRQLLEFDRESNEDITVFINSPGGYVPDMFSIIDTMNIIKSKINVVVLGMAASCAAVIAVNGHKRFISENSRFMLHEVWSFLGGSITEMKDQIDEINKEQDKLVSFLSKKTGRSKEQILNDIKNKDKYLNAK